MEEVLGFGQLLCCCFVAAGSLEGGSTTLSTLFLKQMKPGLL